MPTVKGLTVEISASATKFNKQVKEMTQQIKSTKTEAQELKKQLKIEFDSDKFARAQELSQQALDETRNKANILAERLEYLSTIPSAVDSAEYRKVQEDLSKTQTEVVKLEKSLEELNKIKFDKLVKNVEKVGKGLEQASKAIAPFSAVAAGALAGLAAAGKQAISTGAEIDDLALRFGVSAEKIQEWQYIAAQTGVETEVFNKALIKARSAVLDFSNGKINESTKAIAGLNLELSSFQTQEDMFDGIIDALSSMEDKTLQASYANEIFGDKIANQLLPYFNAGSDAINQFKEEFESMSYLTDSQVSSLAKLDDVLFRIKTSFKNIAMQIGVAVTPIFEKIANVIETRLLPKLESFANWLNSLSDTALSFGLKALAVVAMLAPLLAVGAKIIQGVAALIKIMPILNTALNGLAANPIIAIIALVAILLVTLYTTCEKFRESVNNFIQLIVSAVQPIFQLIGNLLQQLLSLLMPIFDIIGNILAILIDSIITVLQPIINFITLLFNLLMPLINIALIPLKAVLELIKVPLMLIGQLLQWLSPLFELFGKIVTAVFKAVIVVINFVLGIIESAINWVIKAINKVIDAANSVAEIFGGHINTLGEVNLKLDTSELDNLDLEDKNYSIDGTPPNLDTSGSPYDQVVDYTSGGTTNNYDYSTNNQTQNIEVTIENYAEEVDVDNLIREINRKLAEAM